MRQKDEADVTRVVEHPLVEHEDLQRRALVLSDRIRDWRDDDRAGYDQAIALLCEAEDVLREVGL